MPEAQRLQFEHLERTQPEEEDTVAGVIVETASAKTSSGAFRAHAIVRAETGLTISIGDLQPIGWEFTLPYYNPSCLPAVLR